MAKERRQFSREFKLDALARFGSARNVEALARELGIRRELLYVWRKAGVTEMGRPAPADIAPPDSL